MKSVAAPFSEAILQMSNPPAELKSSQRRRRRRARAPVRRLFSYEPAQSTHQRGIRDHLTNSHGNALGRGMELTLGEFSSRSSS